MAKRNFIPSFLLLILIGVSGCKKDENRIKDPEARDLYENSVALIYEFQQKISMAADSLEVDSLESVFEKRITDLNFKYPPETDLKLTEQENDSIYILLDNLKKSKEYRLVSLAQASKEITDSIHSDSIK